ncbi:MAG: hypothetical protein QXM08_07605 [Thermofilaceae archaeon]
MPRVVEGLVRAVAYLALVSVFASVATAVILSLSHVSDLLDEASMRLTGLPAKQTGVSSAVERVALVFIPLIAATGAFGVLVVYFVHRPRR